MTRSVLILALLLSACGSRGVLLPKPGQSLPPRPAGARTQPTPEQLMTPSDQARPQRSDELLLDSHERKSDRFDLPPPG